MTDKMREEFEAWFRAENESTLYCESQWRAWQASRAALVVEMPETDLTGAIGMAHKAVTKRCRSAIEAAGVRVKQ